MYTHVRPNILYREQYFWKAWFLFVFSVTLVRILLSEVTYIPSFIPTHSAVVILSIYNTVGFTWYVCFHSGFYSHPGLVNHLFIWDVCKTMPLILKIKDIKKMYIRKSIASSSTLYRVPIIHTPICNQSFLFLFFLPMCSFHKWADVCIFSYSFLGDHIL